MFAWVANSVFEPRKGTEYTEVLGLCVPWVVDKLETYPTLF